MCVTSRPRTGSAPGPGPGELIERLGYEACRGQRAGTLSGGTRQKLSLTLALMHDPPVLFLDEPYQGFDWQTYLAFWDLATELRAAGTATVVISHLVFEQERFDRICHLTRAGFAPRKTGAGEISSPIRVMVTDR
jgi:ABC-2 type transport system ATP-binding protein